MSITVKFDSPEEIHRLLHLASRDLARVRGHMVMAAERLEIEAKAGRPILAGRQRHSAQKTIETGPGQRKVLEQAIDAMRDALAGAREEGKIG